MLANGNVPMSLGDLEATAFSIVSLAKCCVQLAYLPLELLTFAASRFLQLHFTYP